MAEVNENETPKKKILKRKSKDEGENSQLLVSRNSTRRTRSQAAPDWTVKEAMILVNEYAAVEMECSTAVSTHQKWKIITEHCTAFWGVSRSLNQCRRKWDSMIEEFKNIKQWCDSRFWTMEKRERKKLGLPDEFDRELFEAIDNVVSVEQDEAGSDPDNDINDPDIFINVKVESGLNNVVAELGSKKQKQGSKEMGQKTEEQKVEKFRPGEKKHEKSIKEEKTTTFEEDERSKMEKSLREDANRVHEIINNPVVINEADLKEGEDLETVMARRQADQLIVCWENILKNLKKYTGVNEENDEDDD